MELCKVLIIVNELLDNNEAHSFIGEIVESTLNDENKRMGLSRYLVQ